MKTGLTEKNDGGKWRLSSNFDILYFRPLVNKKHPLEKSKQILSPFPRNAIFNFSFDAFIH